MQTIATTVDGAEAKVHVEPPDDDHGDGSEPAEPVAARRTVPPPTLDDDTLLVGLQKAIEAGTIIPFKQPLSKNKICEAKRHDASGLLAGCSALAVFRHERPQKCGECGKSNPRRWANLCVADMALDVAGENPILSAQTSFDEVDETTLAAPPKKRGRPKKSTVFDGVTGAPIGPVPAG